MLKLNQVSYIYPNGENLVLNKISAHFHPGKFYAIIGKSGSGKTTLLSLLAGLDWVKEGEILFHNKNIGDIDRDIYRSKEIGVIFQQYNLLMNGTAVDNIQLSMEISGTKVKNPKTYAYEILEKVGISREKANRKILKLSGGEQQRVGIARALVNDPDIIIADEPTGNLDEETEGNILTLLADLVKEKNKCVILVTHSQKVCGYADEVYGMNNGVLLFIR